MDKNWKDALKLCGFILIYEPNNVTAKEYLPLLEKRVAKIESQGESSSSSSSDDSDGPEGGGDSTESDASDSTTDDGDSDGDSSSGNDYDSVKKLKIKILENYDDDIEIPCKNIILASFY